MPKQKWQKQTKRIKLRNLRCSEEEDDEDVPFHTKDVTGSSEDGRLQTFDSTPLSGSTPYTFLTVVGCRNKANSSISFHDDLLSAFILLITKAVKTEISILNT